MAQNDRLVCSIAPVEAILRLARDYPVFPCRRHPAEITVRGEKKLAKPKSPLTDHGFQDATKDQNQIRAWWQAHPDALVGVPTGPVSGLVVIDYDEYKADSQAREWIAEHTAPLCAARSHTTLSGGRHYLFRAPAGVEYRGGVSLALGGAMRSGIDVRASGGYIIWWPLHGGSAGGDLGVLPAGLIDERRVETRELDALPKSTPASWSRDKQTLLDALPWLNPADYDGWVEAGMAIHLACAGADDGFSLWHAWSAGELAGECPANYTGISDCRYRWASFRHDKARGATVTIGTLVHRAKGAGWRPTARSEPISDSADTDGPPSGESPPLEAYAEELARFSASGRSSADIRGGSAPDSAVEMPIPDYAPIDWPSLEGREPPPREWIVPEWIPASHVTLFAGKGGIGKTLLAQHFGTALACGCDYLAPLAPKRVLFWAGEDDERELWRRQIGICSYLGVTFSQLAERFRVHSYVGADITMAKTVYGALEQTPMLAELRRQVVEFCPDVVFLDNIGRVFGGNENERHSVTTFVAWVQGICAPAAVVLLGHPAKVAGSEFSGSTAWEGSVRARLYLGDRPPDAPEFSDDDAPPDPTVRYLAKRKANYSDLDLRKFSLIDGVLVPADAPRAAGGFNPKSTFSQEAVRNAVQILATRDIHGSQSTASPAYLPRLAKQFGLLGQLTEKQFGACMRAMIIDGSIARKQIGAYGNRTPKFGLAVD